MIGRVVILVLDGVGTGEMPDADCYGDAGSDTLGNLAKSCSGLNLPNFKQLGLGNLHSLQGINPVDNPLASYGKSGILSKGKDSTIGHWEMMGLVTETPFPTFPEGFPAELIARFEKQCGRKVIGNRVASGTEIIRELGESHSNTGELIVYTSADSVFQIAAHEKVVSLDELYRCCEIARKLLVPPAGVSRVIARPFSGIPGNYVRTDGRRDFSISPTGLTVLDLMKSAGIPKTGVGKVDDLFNHRGITTEHVKGNTEGIFLLLEQLTVFNEGLIFANLVDFDMKWGHRNDIEGFRKGLEEVDTALPEIMGKLRKHEILVITADHGNDPTTPSTDHSREYVPLLVYSPGRSGHNLGTRKTLVDIASTLCEYFDLACSFPGRSFLGLVMDDD